MSAQRKAETLSFLPDATQEDRRAPSFARRQAEHIYMRDLCQRLAQEYAERGDSERASAFERIARNQNKLLSDTIAASGGLERHVAHTDSQDSR